ncbi:two-pore potassium channel 1-like [Mercurialis annua]|uniref:two-pore potassium channel 1-like n=1 Tax=Mercurialis annua TaxID=3986 RepID=UPI00215F237A|nr:two-pore potassium channel 1-like [Mercurialis annua]
MASNGAKLHFPSGLLDAYASYRKRFLSLKHSLLADLIPKDFGSIISLPPPEYIFLKFHPSFRNLAVAFGVYFGVAVLCFYSVYDQMKGNKESALIDTIYFTVTTLTTVGYGDLAPNRSDIKVLSCVFAVIGMALMALIIRKAADYLVEKQEVLLVEALNKQQNYGSFIANSQTESNEISFKCLVVMGALSVLGLLGVMVLYVHEELDFIDSIYCVFTTITTVGYGDKAFATYGGRVFAIVWILLSTVGLAQLFMYLTEVFTESRQKALANWVAARMMMPDHNLISAEIDNDGVAEVAEFAIHKLKAMGKISEEDITSLMKQFDVLDVHQRGFLAISELMRV